ncbi:hypothetical protein EYF80_060436 [Liparis tanakae]|uniref:Uncharacterized protein n=1 Tax=Liparis tanakae TaxID=230148 RepID=A0A4Z2ELU8_9TELE|nr:hypothetical protein EYF80_060436 [Liparis tanakae]
MVPPGRTEPTGAGLEPGAGLVGSAFTVAVAGLSGDAGQEGVGIGFSLSTSRVADTKPQPWHTPFSVSVCTLRWRSQLALVVKADRHTRHTNGRSPLCVRMWISRELALGQLLLHWGKGHTRSLG